MDIDWRLWGTIAYICVVGLILLYWVIRECQKQ